MDFSKIGDFLLENGLPILGGVLGGPAGAAGGKLLASALGLSTDDPQTIMDTIQANPSEALVKLKALEATNKHELQKLMLATVTTSIIQANKTMQEEVKSEDAFVRRARPSLIWSVSLSVMLEIVTGALIVWTAPEQMSSFVALCSAIAVPQGVAAAMCGVYIPARSRDKALAAGKEPTPGLFAALASKLLPPV